MSNPEEKMTERQRAAWPAAIDELRRYAPAISSDLTKFDWTVNFEDESRPGRGHMMEAQYCDGEYYAQVRMDVYGFPSVSIAEVSWLHSSADEECDCEPCTLERDEE